MIPELTRGAHDDGLDSFEENSRTRVSRLTNRVEDVARSPKVFASALKAPVTDKAVSSFLNAWERPAQVIRGRPRELSEPNAEARGDSSGLHESLSEPPAPRSPPGTAEHGRDINALIACIRKPPQFSEAFHDCLDADAAKQSVSNRSSHQSCLADKQPRPSRLNISGIHKRNHSQFMDGKSLVKFNFNDSHTAPRRDADNTEERLTIMGGALSRVSTLISHKRAGTVIRPNRTGQEARQLSAVSQGREEGGPLSHGQLFGPGEGGVERDGGGRLDSEELRLEGDCDSGRGVGGGAQVFGLEMFPDAEEVLGTPPEKSIEHPSNILRDSLNVSGPKCPSGATGGLPLSDLQPDCRVLPDSRFATALGKNLRDNLIPSRGLTAQQERGREGPAAGLRVPAFDTGSEIGRKPSASAQSSRLDVSDNFSQTGRDDAIGAEKRELQRRIEGHKREFEDMVSRPRPAR